MSELCSKICLVCVIGLPSSGKTTLVNNIVKSLSDFNFNLKDLKCYVIEFDKEIKFECVTAWKSKRKSVFMKVENLINSLLNQNDIDSYIIFLDDNMFYRSMRYEYVQIARKYHIGFCQIYLDVSLQKILELNLLRSNSVPENTILKMAEKIEIPNPHKYNWENKSLILKGPVSFDKFVIEKIKNLFIISLKQPLIDQLQNENSGKIITSLLHLADLALRQNVKFLIEKQMLINKKDAPSFTKQIALKRKEILNHLKYGLIKLPELGNDKEDHDIILFYKDYLMNYFLK